MIGAGNGCRYNNTTDCFNHTSQENIAIMVAYSAEGTIIFIANLILIIAVTNIKKNQKNSIYVFLVNLQISDFLKSFALFGALYNVSTDPSSRKSPMNVNLCNALGCLYETTSFVGSCITSFILLDRQFLLAAATRYQSIITVRLYQIINLFNWIIWITVGYIPLVRKTSMKYQRIGYMCQFNLEPDVVSEAWHIFIIIIMSAFPTLSVFIVYFILRPYFLRKAKAMLVRLPFRKHLTLRYNVIVWSHIFLTWPLIFMLIINHAVFAKTRKNYFTANEWLLGNQLMVISSALNPVVLGIFDKNIRLAIKNFLNHAIIRIKICFGCRCRTEPCETMNLLQ